MRCKNKEIAERISAKEQTVKNHVHSIFKKLGLANRLELALYAVHHGLYLEPETGNEAEEVTAKSSSLSRATSA